MNKLIPTTLAAILAIAMVFAFAPADYAQTTHLPTVGSDQISDGSIATGDLADDAVTADKLDDTDGSEAVTTAHLVDNAVTNLKMADDAVGAADTIGANTQDSPFRFLQNSQGTDGTTVDDQSLSIGAYDPPVTSIGLVTCTVEYSDDGTVADGVTAPTLTLAKTAGTGGAIQGQAEITFEDIADTEEDVLMATWAVTGVDDSHDWSCTMGPAGEIETGDLVAIQMQVIYFPQ